MDKWFHEDWRFKIEVIKVGKTNQAKECRLGLELGDVFECTYETPEGFCPTSFMKIFSSMEVVRSGGDLRKLGGEDTSKIAFMCPDGVVKFKLRGDRVTKT